MINSTKLDMYISLGCNDASYCLHCIKICSLVSMSTSSQGHWTVVLGKNLCRYSPIGACSSIIWVNLVYTEFEIPIYGSHNPPLAYISLMTLSLLSSNSRNSYSFFLLSLNNFCHDSSMRLHSFFLLNRNKFFSGKVNGIWEALASLSTRVCLGHSSLLGQYQKCIKLQPFLSRKLCIFSAMGIMDF